MLTIKTSLYKAKKTFQSKFKIIEKLKCNAVAFNIKSVLLLSLLILWMGNNQETFCCNDVSCCGKPEPFKRNYSKVGRNNPCPCGSGFKFKKCCGA